MTTAELDEVVVRLRAAGCVFAEDEAELLLAAAPGRASLDAMVRRRTLGEPLEHIVGWVAFGELRLSVGPGVFVPRQRSRYLAALTADAALEGVSPVIVEACCGVAPLAASVEAAVPSATVIAIDHDARALVHARRNLSSEHVYPGDLLAAIPAEFAGRVDVVTAVPPYVPTGALIELPREARDHEPTQSLVAGDDGLAVVRRILSEAPEWLAPDGIVLLEMNRAQIDPAIAVAGHTGWSAGGVASDDGQTAVLRAIRPRRERLARPT